MDLTSEIIQYLYQMDIAQALAILEDALKRCRNEDMRTDAAFAALSFLEARAKEQWPFDEFRKALANRGMEKTEPETRWQVLNASLNGINRVVPALIVARARVDRYED